MAYASGRTLSARIQKTRAEAGGFLDLCLTPKWASEVTLQPIRRFGFDAAILFADILLIPRALGLDLQFREGEGPLLEKIASEKDIAALKYDDAQMASVYETLGLVKKQLSSETALIGFCGAPWTVACYMIDGNSHDDFALAKNWAKNKPAALEKLVAVLIEASVEYLSRQIEAGAEVVQIFDSWAGLLSAEDFVRWVIRPTAELVRRLRQKHPAIPVIGFPREAASGYEAYIRETGVDALSIDPHVDLGAAKKLQTIKPLQGNLDPVFLVKGGAVMKNALAAIMRELGPTHIVNLGHGVVPETPVQNVEILVDFVRGFKP